VVPWVLQERNLLRADPDGSVCCVSTQRTALTALTQGTRDETHLEALKNALGTEVRRRVDEVQIDEQAVLELALALAQEPVQLAEHLCCACACAVGFVRVR